MKFAGLGIENVLVGEKRIKDPDHRLAVFVANADLRLHGFNSFEKRAARPISLRITF